MGAPAESMGQLSSRNNNKLTTFGISYDESRECFDKGFSKEFHAKQTPGPNAYKIS